MIQNESRSQLTAIKDNSSANCPRQINRVFYINSLPCSHELFKLFIIQAIKQLNYNPSALLVVPNFLIH